MAAKKKNPHETLILIVFLGLVISGALTFLYTMPNLKDAKAAQKELDDAKVGLANAKADLAELQSGGRDIQETIAIARLADGYLPVAPKDGDATIQMRLETAATFESVGRSLGLSMAGIDPQPAAVAGVPDTLKALSVTASLTGGPDIVNRFIDALADQGVLVTVVAVRIAPPQPDIDEKAGAGVTGNVPVGHISASGERSHEVDFLAWYSTTPKVSLPADLDS